MSKRKKQRAATLPPPPRGGAGGDPPARAAWQWRTFPVFAALAVGLFFGSFLDGRPDTDLGVAVRVLAVLMVSYAIIHLFVVNVIVAGRMRRRREILARGEVPAEDLEDELVYGEDE